MEDLYEQIPEYSGMKISSGYMEKKPNGIVPLYSEGAPDFSFDEVENTMLSAIEQVERSAEGYIIEEETEYMMSLEGETLKVDNPFEAEELLLAGYELEGAVSEIYEKFSGEKIASIEYRKDEEEPGSLFKPGRIMAQVYNTDKDIEIKDYFEQEFPEEGFMDENL